MFIWLSLIASWSNLQCNMLGYRTLYYNRVFPPLTVDWGAAKSLAHSIKCGAKSKCEITAEWQCCLKQRMETSPQISWICLEIQRQSGEREHRWFLTYHCQKVQHCTGHCWRQQPAKGSLWFCPLSGQNFNCNKMKARSPGHVNCITSGYVPKLLQPNKKD